ncbi:MAG TPA: ester cyclase [Candidatus Acidoferrum sp.]|nr:ester cyclase [Candidatus Acidoferrum sp.]
MTKRLFAALFCLCVFLLTSSWQARTQTQPSGKALLEAYVSAWNKRDFAALDKLLAPDAVHEDLARPSRDVGPAQIKQFMRTMIETQPDLNWHLTSIVDGGSVVAAEWVWTGTVTGESPVRPIAPRRISGRGASVAVIENGRIKRFSNYYDFASVFR